MWSANVAGVKIAIKELRLPDDVPPPDEGGALALEDAHVRVEDVSAEAYDAFVYEVQSHLIAYVNG